MRCEKTGIPSLYVCSIEVFCGKSMFCLGLALTLREKGVKAGYFKPIGLEMIRDSQGRKIDEDAQLMREVLGLEVPLDVVSPIILSSRFLEETSRIGVETSQKRILQAYEMASKGMDLMIIEGSDSLGVGASMGVECLSLIEDLNSSLLFVSMVDNDTAVDKIILNRRYVDAFNYDFMGAVLNRIPKTDLERIKGFAVPVLEKHGVEVLGVIPDDVSLRAPSVGEICENISCTVLTCENRLDNRVEDLLVGAMNPESALSYFRRSLRKAVITGGDRSDIQLAALQTDTSVLILTGNIYPDVRILASAEELGVPVLLVPHDTYTTVREIGSLSGRIKPLDKKKIQMAKNLVEEHVNWESILQSLREC